MKIVTPAFPVPNLVLFPGCTVTLHISHPALLKQLEAATSRESLVCLSQAQDNTPANVGCLAEVRRVQRVKGGFQVTLAGLERMRLHCELSTGEAQFWAGETLPSDEWRADNQPELPRADARVQACKGRFSTSTWLDIAAFHDARLDCQQKQQILSLADPHERYRLMLEGVETPRPLNVCLN